MAAVDELQEMASIATEELKRAGLLHIQRAFLLESLRKTSEELRASSRQAHDKLDRLYYEGIKIVQNLS